MKVPLGDDVSNEMIETWCDVLVVVKVLGLVCRKIDGDEMDRDEALGKRWKLI